MAEKKKPKKRIRKIASKPTMRELASASDKPKTGVRIRKAGSKASQYFKNAQNFGRKEYHPIKLPNNKFGRFLSKRVRFVPKFLREAWTEIRQTTWPGRRETMRLTFAVFVFSIIFGLFVAFLDYGLDKIFKVLIKS